MEINDTLKFASYGWKKDYSQKLDKRALLEAQNKQYYPADGRGVVDEWQALIN